MRAPRGRPKPGAVPGRADQQNPAAQEGVQGVRRGGGDVPRGDLARVPRDVLPGHLKWDRHGGCPVQAGLQRGGGPVQDGGGHQHLRAGLRRAQALRPRAHQRHAGVGALRRALLPQDRPLQAPGLQPLSGARPPRPPAAPPHRHSTGKSCPIPHPPLLHWDPCSIPVTRGRRPSRSCTFEYWSFGSWSGLFHCCSPWGLLPVGPPGGFHQQLLSLAFILRMFLVRSCYRRSLRKSLSNWDEGSR